ncbi:MAG: cyclophilin-like fold protein [Ruminococcus flavefaciens]|nr:cyclophilin-like fold protein [Ruminococcus flavefaciens]MCM1060962.1 cyclophilin-like fold protein [Eubacterium sp.]
MKNIIICLIILPLFLTITGCRSKFENMQSFAVTTTESQTISEKKVQISEEKASQTKVDSEIQEETDMIINIHVGEHNLTATLVENSSTEALLEILEENPLTINMSDYSNFEKVGSLGTSLPRNDEQITTEPGDLILYQGNSFVIYYDTNSWNFTRLGKINNATKESLLEILGDGDVTVTLSLTEN